MEYIKRRENFLPLAFTFEEPTEGLYEKLLKDNCFVNINGYNGIIKIKGEPNFISAEESYTAIDTFMNFCLLKYTSKGYPSPMTSVLPEDFDLIEKLKANNYDSWNDCKPDYYYLVL